MVYMSILNKHAILQDPGEVMFIKGSLSAQRFLTAVDMADKSLTEEVSRQLWMRAWSRVTFQH